MQGQKGAIGSLPETLNFDHGSTSSGAGLDQQLCWNNMRNPAENRLADYMQPPSDTNLAFLNSISHGGQNLSGWSLGEPSSINTQNIVSCDECKTEHGWATSVSGCAGAGPRFEEHRCEPSNVLSLDNVNVNPSSNQIVNGPLFLQSSSSDAIAQNLNLNAGFVGSGGDDRQGLECPNLYKSSGSENLPSASSSSDPFGPRILSGGYLVEENDGRAGSSLEGRRLSCKRKALEGNIGQSSVGGSSSSFQRTENNVWHAVVPARYNAGNGLSISSPSGNIIGASPAEQVNPRLGLGVRGVATDSLPVLNVPGSAESSHRNFRMRINPSHQQDSVPHNLFSAGGSVRHSNVSSHQQSTRLIPVNHAPDLRSTPAADNASSQSQSVVNHAPNLPRTMQSFRWSGASSSRHGNSSSPLISGERDAAPREESSSRSMPRNTLEHSMFLPAIDLRSLPQNPTNRNLAGGNMTTPGNSASTSRTGSSSGVNSSSAPTWGPPRDPPSQYSRRLSEYVRRSLFSSVGADSGGQSSNYSPLHSGPSPSSQEVAPSSGAGNQGHHQSYPRSALLMERHGDGVLGIPYSLRTLAAASEGRSRLVSEIRNVLDLMRRGEDLRFEDVMILDQSVFFGVADIHDRHRDMRLDVDNMSYEELLALEERIGDVCTGLSEENILKQLKQRKYWSVARGAEVEVEPCCICQEEYGDGEDIGTLECGHDFHYGCIKQWLMHKNLCPICKTTALGI